MRARVGWLLTGALLARCVAAAAAADTAARADTKVVDRIAILRSAEWKEFTRLVREHSWKEPDEALLQGICLEAGALATSNPASPYTPIEACLNASVRALDRAGAYATREEKLRDAAPPAPRQFGSVGLELTRSDAGLRVVAAPLGSPALRAGMLEGDEILAVDGVVLKELKIEHAVSLLRGTPGSAAVLTLRRGPQREAVTVSISREAVPVRYVTSSLRPGDILYCRISVFGNDTASQVLHDVSLAAAALRAGPRRFILDLRAASGGLLDEVVQTAALFVAPGTVVARTTSRSVVTELKANVPVSSLPPPTASTQRILRDVPLVILVDRRTASGAELLAQSLRELRGARLAGDNTFGDVGVRVWHTLPGGMGVKFTTALLQSPSGASWDGIGLAPDELKRAPARVDYGDPTRDALLADELEK